MIFSKSKAETSIKHTHTYKRSHSYTKVCKNRNSCREIEVTMIIIPQNVFIEICTIGHVRFICTCYKRSFTPLHFFICNPLILTWQKFYTTNNIRFLRCAKTLKFYITQKQIKWELWYVQNNDNFLIYYLFLKFSGVIIL